MSRKIGVIQRALNRREKVANLTARKVRVIKATALIGVVAIGGYLVSSANKDPFRFLYELKPTVTTPVSGFLTTEEQKTLKPRARLFFFYQPPQQMANRLKTELMAREGWKQEDQEDDFQTYQNHAGGYSVMFGTGMPRVLMNGPPSKIPTCYIVTVESPGIIDRFLQFLRR